MSANPFESYKNQLISGLQQQNALSGQWIAQTLSYGAQNNPKPVMCKDEPMPCEPLPNKLLLLLEDV